jgi:hypothetical protein
VAPADLVGRSSAWRSGGRSRRPCRSVRGALLGVMAAHNDSPLVQRGVSTIAGSGTPAAVRVVQLGCHSLQGGRPPHRQLAKRVQLVEGAMAALDDP